MARANGLSQLNFKPFPNSPIGWTVRKVISPNFCQNLKLWVHQRNAVVVKILICYFESVLSH